MGEQYRRLDAQPLVATAHSLCQRIKARFPEANLVRVGETVAEAATEAKNRVEKLRRPIVALRAGVFILLGTLVLGLGYFVWHVDFRSADREIRSATTLAQFLDAALQTVALFGGAAFFLATLESRIQRARILKAVHELRSLAHIIDMHQLTKSPDHYDASGSRTKYSVEVRYDLYGVRRYMDYCSELLAIVGKIAVLYVENNTDPVVLDAVDQIENLTTSLARKIWQKLMVFNEIAEAAGLEVDDKVTTQTETVETPAPNSSK